MNPTVLNKLRQRKRRILKRIENRPGPEQERPMITASNIQYQLADRVQGGLSAGGIGAMVLLARKTGLIGDIDNRLQLLKRHLPYHESDHVLNIALNILAGGHKLEHLELRRNDEVYLNALGASFQFDDWNVIVNDTRVQSLAAWWHSMPGIRPLLKLTYAVNHATGFGVVGFHAVNIAIHAANALLVLLLLERLSRREGATRSIPIRK